MGKRLKQVQLTCKIIINCQRCVLSTLVRGFNVIEKFAGSFPLFSCAVHLLSCPFQHLPLSPFSTSIHSILSFPIWHFLISQFSLPHLAVVFFIWAAFALICRFSNCAQRSFVYLKVPLAEQSRAERKVRVKWKRCEKRKIIILQFLIKWQWKLLLLLCCLRCSCCCCCCPRCLLPVAAMQNLSCWKQKLIMGDQNR